MQPKAIPRPLLPLLATPTRSASTTILITALCYDPQLADDLDESFRHCHIRGRMHLIDTRLLLPGGPQRCNALWKCGAPDRPDPRRTSP